MNSPIKIYTNGNKKVKIYQEDDTLESPRMWDNLGIMICFHKRYSLGDRTDLTSEDFNSFSELKDHLIKNEKAVIILPLYLYDHSGITISVNPFSCHWDSGQIGYIYTTKERIDKEELTEERAKEILLNEVKIYDQYLTGDIFRYKYVELKQCKECNHIEEEVIDDCGGFYGMSDCKEVLSTEIKDFENFIEEK